MIPLSLIFSKPNLNELLYLIYFPKKFECMIKFSWLRKKKKRSSFIVCLLVLVSYLAVISWLAFFRVFFMCIMANQMCI